MIKGTVESVKAENVAGKYGPQVKASIKVDGSWYGGFFKPAQWPTNVAQGCVVVFETKQNGEYVNIVPGTVQVSETAAVPDKADKPVRSAYSGSGSSSTAGIKVGHAINNAVQLAIANKDTSLKAIYGHAVDVLSLSVALEGRFEGIVAAASERLKPQAQPGNVPAAAPSATPESAAPSPEPAPVKKAAPKPKAKSEPAPAQQEPALPATTGPMFDDDIPF